MIFQPISLINVFYTTDCNKQIVGRLALKDRKIFFEYDSAFLKTDLPLSPFKLPLKAGLHACEDRLFEGLFGVFNDSLPDGWGRLLLDRKLIKMGINPRELSPLDRLCYVGTHGMGALSYEPEIQSNPSHHNLDFDLIADEIRLFQETDDCQFIDDLLTMNGSSAGARPKVLIRETEEDWIVKFRSSFDPPDIASIEYAYHLMAVSAKLDVPSAKLFPSKKSAGYFGVKRFDRVADKRIHTHTMSGLLHSDHRVPALDYETILKATLLLTRDNRECHKQFRAAVFNILSHNRDDHAKNFSFLMNEKGVWKVSPAYDLTFSSGPAGEHCTTVMGEGKKPTLLHLVKLAETVGIKKEEALNTIDEVKSAVATWKNVAKNAGVSASSISMIQRVLNDT